jgi:hypothetical protein
MARRIVNRMEKRAEYEAYEATQRQKSEDETEELDEEDGEEEETDSEAEEANGEEEDGDEEAPRPAKRKPAKETKTRPRSRAAKVPRMKVVWGVFNNSNQRVATYEYPKRREAEEHAARLQTEKKATFFIQPVKEPFEEKKEA